MKFSSSTITAFAFLLFGLILSGGTVQEIRDPASKRNPFGLRSSGYGMTLARLSQDTINRVWHNGVEQGHHHDEENCKECKSGGKLSSKLSREDHHHGHSHSDHDCADCENSSFWKSPSAILEDAHTYLNGLNRLKTTRTNKYGISKRHKLAMSKKIERSLRNSHLMDPTNYGVYNSYYLFLTAHELGATEEGIQRGREISQDTIAMAFEEKENPEAFLTAASAALNVFFAEQGEMRKTGRTLSRDRIASHGKTVNDCLVGYNKLREKREKDGTWVMIPEQRRLEIQERARFANRTSEQFQVMLARISSTEPAPHSLARTEDESEHGENHE